MVRSDFRVEPQVSPSQEKIQKLMRALKELSECGCSIERDGLSKGQIRLSLPRDVDLSLIGSSCQRVQISKHADELEVANALTPQQTEILLRISAAKPNKLIAYELGITETTVKAHVTNIYRRLGVRNRIEALLLVQKQKLTAGTPGQAA